MTHSLDLQQKSGQNQQQIQRLIMSPAMQQAIHLMQLPAMELGEFVETTLAQNPVMERIEEHEDTPSSEEEHDEEGDNGQDPEKELSFSENDFSVMQQLEEDFRDYFEEESKIHRTQTSSDERLQTFLEQSICAQPSLFEHLKTQAEEALESDEDRAAAEGIIGNLDEFGYLHTPLSEISKLHHVSEQKLLEILEIIQTFEPYGVGARDLRECLMIQLRCWGKQDTLAATIIEKHFDELLHNRIPAIQSSLGCTVDEIKSALAHDMSRLDLRPGACYLQRNNRPIVPDATLIQEGEQFRVEINNDYIPGVRINHRYMRMAADESVAVDTKQFIHRHVASAKWLLKNIHQRNETLERIVKALSEKQRTFFSSPEGELVPLTMGMVADELSLHESTIARAVANKYMQSPRGLLPLRSFFSNAYTTNEGKEISSDTVRGVLSELIQQEDKRHPHSDSVLATLLKERGIPCARRTVAKYRTELHVGTAQQRKKF